jgi:hypothetical protein
MIASLPRILLFGERTQMNKKWEGVAEAASVLIFGTLDR